MSNIAGKAYAMNLLTPIKKYKWQWLNRLIFVVAHWKWVQKRSFGGLLTLSLIHYARWVIIRDKDLPVLSKEQPEEKLTYAYMLFLSNFNGSWTQYVDSFSMAIPAGLNLLWFKNVGWPKAVPETTFNKYVISNQIWTEHYYNAYPLASSNDVKSAREVKRHVTDLCVKAESLRSDEFLSHYKDSLLHLQCHLSQMEETPVVSLAHEATNKRKRLDKKEL
jgi:hypothetical protein